MGLFKRKQVSRFYFLRNDDLVVYINNQGAELMSVKDVKIRQNICGMEIRITGIGVRPYCFR